MSDGPDLQVIRRAHQARMELSETREVLDAMRARALELIATSTAGAMEKREHLYRHVQVIDAFRAGLVEIVAAGALEEDIDKFLTQDTPNE